MEPKKLDAWSWRLKFGFQLHSPVAYPLKVWSNDRLSLAWWLA